MPAPAQPMMKTSKAPARTVGSFAEIFDRESGALTGPCVNKHKIPAAVATMNKIPVTIPDRRYVSMKCLL
jgi:hypothetical protein